MEPGPYKQAPLEPDEKNLLLFLYHKRRRYMFFVYAFLFVLAFTRSARGLGQFPEENRQVVVKWDGTGNTDALHVTRLAMWFISITWLEGILACTAVFYYFKKVLPLKRDADSGVKEKVPYRVIRKEYDVTRQYYVALDDPDYMHELLDENTYYNCNVGDFVYVSRGVKSGFIFEGDGRFSIM